MVVPDPVDARLLGALADHGRIGLVDLAARLGMDQRDVAVRLVNLALSGLPLRLGAECDQRGLRAFLGAGPPQRRPGPAMPPRVHPAQPVTPPGQVPPPQPVQQPQPGQPVQPQVPVAPDPTQIWGPPQDAGWTRGDRQD